LKSSAYSVVRETFKSSGYGLTEVILDASKCGVPQKRKRLFVIGCLGECDNFILDEIKNNTSKDSMTVRDYFGDELSINHYYRHPRNYNRRGVFSIDEPAPTIRGVNRPIPDGYKGHPGDPVDVLNDVRPLTTLERARIQTFPKDFKFKGSKTNLEQIIGNAVPVELAKYVAKTINDYIKKSAYEMEYNKEGFRVWLSENKKLAKKSLGDILSRFNRATSFFGEEIIDFNSYKLDEILMKLERNDAFHQLNVSLKSQLRRTFKLYHEYCNDGQHVK